MFQIKYDTIFLDLADNQECEIERNSPLFLIDSFFAEFSTPVSIPYSDKNARVLGFYFFEPTLRTRKKFPVQVFDNGTYKCNGILVLESAGMNHVHAGASTASGYLLVGISDFYQTVQTKKLTDLVLGGSRTFNFTSFDITDGSNGWWQHFHATWNGNADDFDYVLPTVRNETWTGSADDPFSTGYMNALNTSGSSTTLKQGKPVTIFTYLKYVLECIFLESGWTVDFSGINDVDWTKLILFSAKSFDTAELTYVWNDETEQFDAAVTPKSSITINLNEFMPQDYTCAQLITAVCLRYGLAPITNSNKKFCRFVALKEVGSWKVKNWTKYSRANTDTQISLDSRIFSFRNNFEGNDNFPSSPDFEGWDTSIAVNDIDDLPNPMLSVYDTKLVYVFRQNQYYKVGLNDEETERVWIPYSDNIYDETPAEGTEATDTYETKCTTLPVYKTLWRTASSVDYFAWFPLCEQDRTEKWGIRTLLYHGMVKEVNADGEEGTFSYPYASSYYFNHADNNTLSWSNVYKHKNLAGNDYGIIPYWFKKWMATINNVENNVKKKFDLPLFELLQFDWNNIILDKNIPFLIKQVIEPLPYKGYIECICQRLNKIQSAAEPVEPTNPIYLKLVYRNIFYDFIFHYDEGGYSYTYNNATRADVYISAFADAAGTFPIDATGINAKIRITLTKDGDPAGTTDSTHTVVDDEILLDIGLFSVIEWDYVTDYNGGADNGHYIKSIELLPDPAYNIII